MWRNRQGFNLKMAKSRQHMANNIDESTNRFMYSKPPKIKLEYDIEPTDIAIILTVCWLITVLAKGAHKVTYHERSPWRARCYNQCERYRNFHTETYRGIYPTRGGNISWERKREDILARTEHADPMGNS